MDYQTIIIVGVILGFLIAQLVRYSQKHVENLALMQLSHAATVLASSEYVTERILHHQIATSIHLTKQDETVVMLPPNTYTKKLQAILRVYQTAGAIDSWTYHNRVELPHDWKEPDEISAYIVIRGVVDQDKAKEVHEILLEAQES